MCHEKYMRQALELACQGGKEGEVPVGCVIVDDTGAVIGTGRNRREKSGLATAHAEIEAIESACRQKGTWRLNGCSMYVTLEPCPMCAGAIINARIGRLFYGAREANTGSCGSVINLFMENYGHEPKITGGILEEECGRVLSDFFDQTRNGGDR